MKAYEKDNVHAECPGSTMMISQDSECEEWKSMPSLDSPDQSNSKVAIPKMMLPFNHNFYRVERNVIVEFNFTNLNINETPCSELFRVSVVMDCTALCCQN